MRAVHPAEVSTPIKEALANPRLDSWQNFITGVGQMGRSSFQHETCFKLDDTTLEELFYDDAYANRICSSVPEEALRRGFGITAAFDDSTRALKSQSAGKSGDALAAGTAIGQWFDAMHLPTKIMEAWTWGRLFGGGALLLGCDDGLDPQYPLDMKALEEVLYIVSLDKRELSPIGWFTDPMKPNFGEPSLYQLTRTGGVSVDTRTIHASRVIRFDGAMTNRRKRQQNASWSESELQRVYGSLQKFNGAYEAVGTLLQESSQGVFKIKDLFELMSADSNDTLKKRLELMDIGRSVARAIMVDADTEDFARVEVGALSGLPDVLRMFVLLLSGASQIPVTILMGQAPAGLSATGDSDIRTYYDRVDSARRNYLKPRLIRLATIICAANKGPTHGVVPRIDVVFPSMYQQTPLEESKMRLDQAQADAVYLTNNVVTAEEIATSRFRPEGWSPETVIDMKARESLAAAPEEADTPTTEPGAPPKPVVEKDADGEPQVSSATLTPAQSQSVMDIVERVGSRAISREAGVGLLTAGFPLTPQQADGIMGETGRSAFTTPEPSAVAEHEALKTAHAKLQRSHQGTKAILGRVLSENKAGRLVKGNVFGKGVPVDDEKDPALAPDDPEATDTLKDGPPYDDDHNPQPTKNPAP